MGVHGLGPVMEVVFGLVLRLVIGLVVIAVSLAAISLTLFLVASFHHVTGGWGWIIVGLLVFALAIGNEFCGGG